MGTPGHFNSPSAQCNQCMESHPQLFFYSLTFFFLKRWGFLGEGSSLVVKEIRFERTIFTSQTFKNYKCMGVLPVCVSVYH